MPNINKKPGKNRVYGPQPGGPGYVAKPSKPKRAVGSVNKTRPRGGVAGPKPRTVGKSSTYRKAASTMKKRAR